MPAAAEMGGWKIVDKHSCDLRIETSLELSCCGRGFAAPDFFEFENYLCAVKKFKKQEEEKGPSSTRCSVSVRYFYLCEVFAVFVS